MKNNKAAVRQNLQQPADRPPPRRRRHGQGGVHRLLMAALRLTYRVERKARERAMGQNLLLGEEP